ncbi:hypothetical protein M422DRAFT_39932, partial [Sphaerobolus stellatus SS14]
MPNSTTPSGNPPLSSMPGSRYENIRADGGRNHFGNAYYYVSGTVTQEREARSVLQTLEPHINRNAAYNSFERGQEGALICMPGTREKILTKIQGWVGGEGPPVLWLHGPAGAGKSTIAQTIAEQCDKIYPKKLAFSYFFSKRNKNRDDLAKFMPTFAYQLVCTVPSLGSSVREAIHSDPSIFSLRLEDQAQALIVKPLGVVAEEMPSMVIVIDGLDEYSDVTSNLPLKDFIHILVRALTGTRIRIIFASRPEPYITATFNQLQNVEIMRISLQDWETKTDVYKYLKTELSRVHVDKGIRISSWPSEDDLQTLVEKSEGIFIYASTLIKFIGDRNCNSMVRLQDVMKSHNGLDSLCTQVLVSAKEHDDFQCVLGFIMFLRQPFSPKQLAQFLQLSAYSRFPEWSTNGIRFALRGSSSILLIPDGDDYAIRPFHASLQDFLKDKSRSGEHFLDPAMNHEIIFYTSARLISNDTDFFTESGQIVSYAYCNWCYHLTTLINSNNAGVDRSFLMTAIEDLMERLSQDCVARLVRMQSHEKAESWLVELEEVLTWIKRERSDLKALVKVGEQLQEKVH